MWNVNCAVSSVEREVRSAKCGVECDMFNVLVANVEGSGRAEPSGKLQNQQVLRLPRKLATKNEGKCKV